MSLNRWAAEYIVIHPHHGIVFGDEKEQVIDSYNNQKILKRAVWSETNQGLHRMILFTWHSWNDNVVEIESRLVVVELWMGKE